MKRYSELVLHGISGYSILCNQIVNKLGDSWYYSLQAKETGRSSNTFLIRHCQTLSKIT